jgi:putative ABC transport system ATP-binding protein
LDSGRSQEITNILNRLHRECGLTILMVTHNLELAKQTERVLTIQDGAIKQDSQAQ